MPSALRLDNYQEKGVLMADDQTEPLFLIKERIKYAGTELKKGAKASDKSHYIVDRRKD